MIGPSRCPAFAGSGRCSCLALAERRPRAAMPTIASAAARAAPTGRRSGGRPASRPTSRPGSEPDDERAAVPRLLDRIAAARSLQTVALFGLISLAPVALAHAHGLRPDQHRPDPAPPGPGQPPGARQPGHHGAVAAADGPGDVALRRDGLSRGHLARTPRGRSRPVAAWDAGSRPIKAFMVEPDRS